MPPNLVHSHPAAESRQRGLPAIGFQLDVPAGVELEQTDPAGEGRAVVLRALERDSSSRLIGELELGVFSAGLIIDRMGVLEELVRKTAEEALTGRVEVLGSGEVSFERGASGYRLDVVLSETGCPYVSWIALAPADLAVRGGVFATVRSATPVWVASRLILDSLRISGLGGARSASGGGGGLRLPFVGGR